MPTATTELTTPTLQAEGPWRLRAVAGPYSDRALVLTAFFGGLGGGLLMAAVTAKRVGADRGIARRMVGVLIAGVCAQAGLLLGLADGATLASMSEPGGAFELIEDPDRRRLFRALGRVVSLLAATAWLRILRAPTRQRMTRQDGLDHPNGFWPGLLCIVAGTPLGLLLSGVALVLAAGVARLLGLA